MPRPEAKSARRLGALLLALGLGLALRAQAQAPPTRLQQAAEAVAKYFRANPAGVADLFAPAFLAQVPAARLQSTLAEAYNHLGAVTGVQLAGARGGNAGVFKFEFAKGYVSAVTLTINGAPSHNIIGMVVGPPTPLHDSFATVLGDLHRLPGQTSFLVQRLADAGGGATTLAEWQPNRPLAIGSAFKLYVLGALTQQIAEHRLRWDQVAKLSAHSLPSGQLQNWPLGAPLTVQSLASLMLSISDNTAADQLIHLVGRDRVEAAQKAMGNGHAILNQPFLTTWELFQLKYGDAGRRAKYLSDGIAARRALVATLAPTATPELARPLEAAAAGAAPTDIESLEWLASAADVAHALAWFRAPDEATARSLLAINTGIPLSGSKWDYVGFKGGSEPGVISLNFLLRSRAGHWYAVAAIWNNPAAPINENDWIALVGRAVNLLPN